ncbi:histone acetyltransferase [Fusarium oxysporum f. sp. lycopersici 4287]|nr:histone acetyltransferase [Fusarium oxysporum f. sp. lycopersici 4287]EXK26742.1 histone acetyltransferase [Fusarium oxysporum f. sp. melonis 26406]KNB18480.1 histone acetyltransferase [Fusarium oxysporum f. sp. lycopersici 4287]
MEARLEAEQYMTPKDFIKDARLIFDNCRQFNDENSLYVKCANKLEKYMWRQIRKISEWSHLE